MTSLLLALSSLSWFYLGLTELGHETAVAALGSAEQSLKASIPIKSDAPMSPSSSSGRLFASGVEGGAVIVWTMKGEVVPAGTAPAAVATTKGEDDEVWEPVLLPFPLPPNFFFFGEKALKCSSEEQIEHCNGLPSMPSGFFLPAM